MANKQEEKLKELIRYKQEIEYLQFRQWFLKEFETSNQGNNCTLEEFAVYFLNSLRQHTEVHCKTSGTETPKCQTPVRTLKPNQNREETSTPRRLMMDLSLQETTTPQDNLSLKKDKETSYSEFGSAHSTPRLSTSVDRSGYAQKNTTSTPIRRNISGNSRRQSTTPVSTNKSATSSLCLGDFLVINTSTHNRSHKKKSSTPQNAGQQQQQTSNEKPKKRLQPISISKKAETTNNTSSIFAGESSFSNDNNILKISNSELEDKEQCAILQARKSLRLNASEITKEMIDVSLTSTSVITDTIATSTPSKEVKIEDPPLDLKKLKNNLILKRLAEIYAILIDLNLTTNILNELSFLLNLLNASNTNNAMTEICKDMNHLQLQDLATNEGLECLEDLTHAVYFALQCLSLQKQALSSLDTKSLSVVLSSERFSYLAEEVKTFLLEIYQRKQNLLTEKPFHDTSICFDSKPCNNVYFQEDQDSRQNFTSHQEFANFRAQRDLFCKCLKIWESNHLNPMWKFSTEITPKIKDIFQHSENCINMAHFAKLFVSQLLLSASNTASPEEMGLDVDLQKFTKLTQRLIAPSQFSVDYQFPRLQAFFRDFIIDARSSAFAEQLKMELYAELISLNDSSFEHININKVDNDSEDQNVSLMPVSCNQHVIVRPEILNSMLILAKFLGFTTSLPFNLNGSQTVPVQVEKKQIRLRTLMQPTFDICIIVQDGIEQGKLLITIPWMVQYLAMLDNVTLQLDTYAKALKVLFALYWYMGLDDSKPLHNTSLFIVRLCLGWLFESKQFVAEQYYNFRALINGNSQELTNELSFVKTKLSRNTGEHERDNNLDLNPLLESILPVACPFLAEFRVSIMPAKYAQTKNASRTGRYRHITTRITELPTTPQIKEGEASQSASNNKPKQIQNNLIQAFLHSQNSSTRHIINFCTERCYKSVVKDGQLKILLPGKTNADNLVNKITSSTYRFVYNEIKTIYKQAHSEAVAKWKESIPQMINTRIRSALDSLLPEETSLILKKTYCMIIKKDTEHKIAQWFYANMIKESFFCNNLEEMANKICSANKNKVQLGSSDLTITKAQPSVSDIIDDLQYWLHCTSARVELFKDLTGIVKLLKSLLEAFDNILPSVLYRLMAAGIIQLLQHIIAKHNIQLSNELLEAASKVWLHPNMQQALSLSKPLQDKEKSPSSSGCIFDALITIAFIESLGTKTHCYNELSRLLVHMIEKGVISLNYTNQLFVSIFKHEWHPFILKEISNMLRNIAKEAALVSHNKRCDSDDGVGVNAEEENDEKSILFMDMLADLSRDVDFF